MEPRNRAVYPYSNGGRRGAHGAYFAAIAPRVTHDSSLVTRAVCLPRSPVPGVESAAACVCERSMALRALRAGGQRRAVRLSSYVLCHADGRSAPRSAPWQRARQQATSALVGPGRVGVVSGELQAFDLILSSGFLAYVPRPRAAALHHAHPFPPPPHPPTALRRTAASSPPWMRLDSPRRCGASWEQAPAHSQAHSTAPATRRKRWRTCSQRRLL